VYAGLFLALGPLGDQPANTAGAVASSEVASELHRRLTFRAGARVGWRAAQVQGGGTALAGLALSALALAGLLAVLPGGGPALQVTAVASVNGAVGLVRFAALRWLFTGSDTRPARRPAALRAVPAWRLAVP